MAQVTPKIPIASVSGGDPKLTITEENWQRIQDAYRSDLSPDLRKKIYEATIAFLQFVPFEQTAQPVSIARQKIKRVRKAATALQKAILEHPQSDAGDATLYATRLINRYFDDGSITGRDKLGFLGKLMGPLLPPVFLPWGIWTTPKIMAVAKAMLGDCGYKGSNQSWPRKACRQRYARTLTRTKRATHRHSSRSFVSFKRVFRKHFDDQPNRTER